MRWNKLWEDWGDMGGRTMDNAVENRSPTTIRSKSDFHINSTVVNPSNCDVARFLGHWLNMRPAVASIVVLRITAFISGVAFWSIFLRITVSAAILKSLFHSLSELMSLPWSDSDQVRRIIRSSEIVFKNRSLSNRNFIVILKPQTLTNCQFQSMRVWIWTRLKSHHQESLLSSYLGLTFEYVVLTCHAIQVNSLKGHLKIEEEVMAENLIANQQVPKFRIRIAPPSSHSQQFESSHALE